jgi:type VI secretion system protein VasJ
LANKSKDVRLFCFLALCYLKETKWIEFCDLFDALGQLASSNYAALYPLRPRAKQLAFKWLGEARFPDVLEAAPNPPLDTHEHIGRLLQGLTALKPVLEAEFPNGSPFPMRLFTAAQKWHKATEPPKEAPPPPPSAAPTAAVSASSAPVQPAATGGTQTTQGSAPVVGPEGFETPKATLELVRKAALFLIESEPHKASGYRLLRTARWSTIDAAPPAEANQTRIEPPAEERRTFISSLLGKGDYKAALAAAEKTFSSGTTHYWFELQKVAATAAAELGKPYAAVREAIMLETALLLQRVPQLKDLTYTDGTPFCDAAVRDWIETDVASMLSSASPSASSGPKDDAVENERREANALIADNKGDAALDLLCQKISSSGSARDSFRRKLAAASALSALKRADLAMYLLEQLEEAIERYELGQWEPQLAAEVYALQARAIAAAAGAKEGAAKGRLAERREEVLKKLTGIDFTLAYKQKQ